MSSSAASAPAFAPYRLPPAPRSGVPVAVALLIGTLAILANAGVPYGLDQGLFVALGQWMNAGARLYGEVWDIKQPGIYGFYAFAQSLGGPGWHSVVVLYALCVGCSAATATWIYRQLFPRSPAWWVVPLLTAGVTALRMNSDHYAEIEGIVDLPLLLTIAFGIGALRSPRFAPLATFLSGVMAALVGLFKLVLCPVAAAVFLTMWLQPGRARRPLRDVALWLAGFALVTVPLLVHLHLQGVLQQFLWTTFRYPLLVLADIPRAPIARLRGSLQWLAFGYALALPAIVKAVLAGMRDPAPAVRAVVTALLLWIVTAAVMILSQKFSWWGYHFELLLWPLGVLAAIGVGLETSPRSPARPFGPRVPVQSLRLPVQGPRVPALRRRVPGLGHVATVSVALALAMNLAHTTYKRRTDPYWTQSAQITQSLRLARTMGHRADAPAPCGTAYVFGDARLFLESGLRQPIAEVGMNWFSFHPALLARLPAQLDAARPDLVYVDVLHQEFLARQAPAIGRWLDAQYAPVDTDALDGRWYRRTTPNAAGRCPAAQHFEIPALD